MSDGTLLVRCISVLSVFPDNKDMVGDGVPGVVDTDEQNSSAAAPTPYKDALGCEGAVHAVAASVAYAARGNKT